MLKARVSHEGGGYLVRTNQLGFRSEREFTIGRNGSTRRILLFGNSFTAGDGVSNGRRYSDRLEELIPDLEVYNFGLPGSGTDQQYLAYQQYAQGIEHDLLVIAVLVENIRRVVARYRYAISDGGDIRCSPKPYFTLEAGRLELRNVPVPRGLVREDDLPEDERSAVDRGGRFPLVRALARRTGVRELAQRVTRYQPLPEYGDPRGGAWLLLRAILKEWISRHSRPVLLMPLPVPQYVEATSDPAPYQARFRELAADAGCQLHDPLPDLVRHPRSARRRFRFAQDIHPTPEGHAALAASLAPAIERLLPDVRFQIPP